LLAAENRCGPALSGLIEKNEMRGAAKNGLNRLNSNYFMTNYLPCQTLFLAPESKTELSPVSPILLMESRYRDRKSAPSEDGGGESLPTPQGRLPGAD
jgi:hypothetical protein